jgi:transcriptional regulator with XRE-family HTH domain
MTGVEKMPLAVSVSPVVCVGTGYNAPRMALLTLGKVFRLRREEKGPAWTQGYVARRAGLHVSSVVKVEKDRARVTIETQEKIAAALGTTLEALRAEVATSSAGVESSTVDLGKRTRYTPATPQPVLEMSTGEDKEKAVREFTIEDLFPYWTDLDDRQRQAVIAVAATMVQRSHRDPGRSKNQAG